MYKSKVVCFLCAQKGKGGMFRNERRETKEERRRKDEKHNEEAKNRKQTE